MEKKHPNWKVESDYDYIDDLTPDGVGFEFLRRNKLYISFYNDYITIGNTMSTQVDNIVPLQSCEEFQTFIKNHSSDRTKTNINDKERVEYSLLLHEIEYFKSQNKWHMEKKPINPSSPAPDSFRFSTKSKFPFFPNSPEELEKYFFNPMYCQKNKIILNDSDLDYIEYEIQALRYKTVVIDIDGNINEQMDTIKKKLKKLAANIKSSKDEIASKITDEKDLVDYPDIKNYLPLTSKHRDHFHKQYCILPNKHREDLNYYKTLIRILDAKKSGATGNQISKIIFVDPLTGVESESGGDDKVSDNFANAKLYRDRLFYKIPKLLIKD